MVSIRRSARKRQDSLSSSFLTSYLMPSNRLRRLSFLRLSRPNAVESSLENLKAGRDVSKRSLSGRARRPTSRTERELRSHRE